MSMWGRLSSLGQGLQEFTREVIAPDDSDDEDSEHKEPWSPESDTASYTSAAYTENPPNLKPQNQIIQQPDNTPQILQTKQPDNDIWRQKYEQQVAFNDQQVQHLKQNYNQILHEAEQKHITNNELLKQQIQTLQNALAEKDRYISTMERAPRKQIETETRPINLDTDAELEEMTQAFENIVGPASEDLDDDEKVVVILTTPMQRDELWSLLCNNFDKRVAAVKQSQTIQNELNETGEILKEYQVQDLHELVANMKQEKTNIEIKLSQVDLDSQRTKRTLAEATRKLEFLTNGLLDVLKKLQLTTGNMDPTTVSMKELMEFVQGIGDQLAQGQASSVTLYNLAQFFKQRGAEDTQDYNKLVVDQVQQLVQVNQQLMSKLSRLESDKQQFLENQNNIEQSTREQIHDLSKKLESSNGIIDELQKQVHEKHRQMTAMRTDCETQLNQLHQNVQDLLAEKAHMSEMIQHNHSKVAQEQIQTQSLQQELEQWKERERLAQQKKQQLNMEIDKLNNKIANQATVIKDLESSLERLESVLNQMQSESESEVSTLRTHVDTHKRTVSTLQIQLDSAKRVQLELEESKQKYDKLKQEMERREISANEVLGRFETMKQMLQDAVGRVNDDNLIDRRVLARLLFTIADNKSKRILDLIAGMLRANEEEKSILLRLLVGETKQTRSSWFGGGTPAPSTQLPQKSNAHSSSLSKMWVAFLMEEATGSPRDLERLDIPSPGFHLPAPEDIPSPIGNPPVVFKTDK